MGHNQVCICLARYSDYVIFHETANTRLEAWEFDEFESYTRRDDGTILLTYNTWNPDQELSFLQNLAAQSVEIYGYSVPDGHPVRQVEGLDWPLFYGHTRLQTGQSMAFVSCQYDPHLLALPCDTEGNPLPSTAGLDRERLIRSRQNIQEFARLVARHRPELAIHGPDIEDFQEERRYGGEAFDAEKRRRNRVSTAGRRPEAWKGPSGPERDFVTEHDSDAVFYGGRKDVSRTPDEHFESALGSLFERRRQQRR